MYKVGRSRTPQGVRGLKPFLTKALFGSVSSRTPQGVRGLKHYLPDWAIYPLESHSARSAWIETYYYFLFWFVGCVALRKECVD